MNVAVILSAGTGSRFGADIPKQFINLAGKNIIEYTLNQFQVNELIDEICIVANKEYHEKLVKLSHNNGCDKVRKIIAGGKERYDSSYEAIKAYESYENVNLVFHDAVRPFVSNEIITNTIKALHEYDSIDVAIPTADTIIQINEQKDIIESIPRRDFLRRGQTPQAFKLNTIKKAHELARQSAGPLLFTDDCGLVKTFLPNVETYVVPGEEKNIKITYPEDLLFAEKLIQLDTITNTQSFINNEALQGKVVVIFGGNSGIGSEIAKLCESSAHVYRLSRQSDLDITNNNAVEKKLQDIYATHQRIDFIVNCVGYLQKNELNDLTKEEIAYQINVNFTAAVALTHASFEYLKESQGMLLHFTSSSYTRGRELYSLYSATKAAIVNFTQAISSEWQKYGIKVNAINPARTKTKMRTDNFGIEPEGTLLEASYVAQKTVCTMLSSYSGLIIDIKKGL